MRVLSVDIGERNFAYCVWSAARGFYDMQVVDLREIKGDSATKMRVLQDRGVFDDCDVVLVERQMRSKFKEMATAIRCFNWGKTVLVAPQSVKRAFKTGTGKHSTNKKAHVALARSFLSEQETEKFDAFRKKDDVADTIMQVMWYRKKFKV